MTSKAIPQKDVITGSSVVSAEFFDVLSLLVLMIHADKRVVDKEVATFIRAADKIQVACNMEPRLTETRLQRWYNDNNLAIRTIFESGQFETWFKSRLNGTETVEDKLPLITALFEIAASDGDIHVSERDLISLLARHWGITF